jgi:hypothetical protein
MCFMDRVLVDRSYSDRALLNLLICTKTPVVSISGDSEGHCAHFREVYRSETGEDLPKGRLCAGGKGYEDNRDYVIKVLGLSEPTMPSSTVATPVSLRCNIL